MSHWSNWSDDWGTTAKGVITAAGFKSISDLCAQHPGLTYVQLSKVVSGGAVAPAQLRILQMEEAILSGQLHQVLRDCFVRTYNEHARHGWGSGARWKYNAVSIVVSMQTTLSVECIGGDYVDKMPMVWAALVDLNPPNGWRPNSPEDDFVRTAFALVLK